MSRLIRYFSMARGKINLLLILLVSSASPGIAQQAELGETLDVGATGFDIKRPVMAAACPHACPWGELGDFVKEAVEPLGYDVILCRNCNRDRGPRLVATAGLPPPLDPLDRRIGTTVRVNARVDFGVTSGDMLTGAYAGGGPSGSAAAYTNLRLIARIEDPFYVLVAATRESGITDLAQIRERRLPVRILAGASSNEILSYYGLNEQTLASFGASIGRSMGAGADAEFDLIIDNLGSPAMNPESVQWTNLSQHYDLHFIQLPEELLQRLADSEDMERVTVKWGFLRGIDREIETIARSGEVIFARTDTPEQAAYDIARAIDANRDRLKWYVRPYSYDSRTVWHNSDVPLHPGAERYYREKGYMR